MTQQNCEFVNWECFGSHFCHLKGPELKKTTLADIHFPEWLGGILRLRLGDKIQFIINIKCSDQCLTYRFWVFSMFEIKMRGACITWKNRWFTSIVNKYCCRCLHLGIQGCSLWPLILQWWIVENKIEDCHLKFCGWTVLVDLQFKTIIKIIK